MRQMKNQQIPFGHAFFAILFFCGMVALIYSYMLATEINIPIWDQWKSSTEIVRLTHAGELTIDDIFQTYARSPQRVVFSNLIMAIAAAVGHTSFIIENRITLLLAVATIFLAVHLFRRHTAANWPLLLIVVSFFVLSPRLEVVWRIGTYGTWLYPTFFLFLGLVFLDTDNPAWWRFFAAAACATAGMLANLPGVALWGVFWLYMLLRGDSWRRWSYLSLWIAVAFVVFVLFIYGSLDPESRHGNRGWSPLFMIEFLLSYIGYPIASMRFATISAVVSLLFGGINIWIAYRLRETDILTIVIPIVAYPVAVGLLASLGRSNPFVSWYRAAGLVYWLGGTVLLIHNIIRLRQYHNHQTWITWSRVSNLVAVGAIFMMSVYTTGQFYQGSTGIDRQSNDDISPAYARECVKKFVLSVDVTCLIPYKFDGEAIYDITLDLARNERAIFSQDTIFDLPVTITAAPVIVETHSVLQSAFFRRWVGGAPEAQVHLYEQALPASVRDQWQPFLSRILADTTLLAYEPGNPPDYPPALSSRIQQAKQLWYINLSNDTLPDDVPRIDDYVYAVQPPVSISPIATQYMTQLQLRETDSLNAMTHFGDLLTLRHWQIADTRWMACDTLMLDSLWTARQDIAIDYSLTALLVNEDSQSFQVDSGFAIPTSRWAARSHLTHADTRAIVIPCDAEPGSYSLLLRSHYYQAPNEPLLANGEPYYYLTTITIR